MADVRARSDFAYPGMKPVTGVGHAAKESHS